MISNVLLKQVQSGGSFDVDYTVTAPGGKIVLDGTKERQGDHVFTAQSNGEYSFCFNNEMSTFAEKMVDFEIAVCDPRKNTNKQLHPRYRHLQPISPMSSTTVNIAIT